jgi:hypothetical protein
MLPQTVVAVIIWKLDLQLPVQSVPITTKVKLIYYSLLIYLLLGLGLWCLMPLSTLSHNVVSSTPCHGQGSNSQL